MSKGVIIKPPTRLADKVMRFGGPDAKQATAAGEQAIKAHAEGFVREMLTITDRLEEAHKSAVRFSDPAPVRDALYEAAHEIRGQSGTFNYPLASTAADALCKYLDARPLLGAADLPFVTLHVQAISAVFRQNLTGEGGAMGRELGALLAAMRAKAQVVLASAS